MFSVWNTHLTNYANLSAYPSGNSYTHAYTKKYKPPCIIMWPPTLIQTGFCTKVYWFALSCSSLYSGTGSCAAVQPRGFSDTRILRHRQSLTHKLIDLWFVVRVENSCCRLIKYSRRFNAKYWKTLSGRRVKFLKTCWSHGARPVQEDLHLAMINVSNGSGWGCFTLRGLPDMRAKIHIGFGPASKLRKSEAVIFQGLASRAA